MTTLRTALTALLFLATAGSAHAAAPWSAPLTLGPPANGSDVIGVGFSSRGEGLLGFRLGQSGFLASLRADGVVGPPKLLPAELAAGPVLPTGAPVPEAPTPARAIVILRRLLAPGPPPPGGEFPEDRTRISWALARPDGTLERVHPLTIAKCLTCQVTLAVNWRGEAIAVWKEDRGGAIRGSWRPAGGDFGAPTTILTAHKGQYPDFTAAIGADGRAIVVDAGEVVRARVRTRRRGFGPVMRVGRGDEGVDVGAAISNGGRAIVAWGSQDGGEDANRPWVVRAARLRRGGRRFSATQTLDPGSAIERPEGRIAIGFTPGGKATVAWSAVAAGNAFPVMAATAAKVGGRFGAPQQLAPSGAVGAIAVRADGAAVVAWSLLAGSQQPIQVFGSVRPAGAEAFGPPEAIGGRESGFFPPRVAIDPVTGRPTAAWGSRLEISTAPQGIDDATVHVASRAAP